MPTAITATNVSHAFDDRAVLEGVSFAIEKGGFFIVIGPNGSGKTTLLKLLVGLLPLKQGRIDILSKNSATYSSKSLARNIAYVPQSVPVEFPFTVLQIVLMGRAPHLGLLGFESEAGYEHCPLCHGHHRRGAPGPSTPGSALRRRTAARLHRPAICQQPKILLLDEPTAALDLAHQVRLMDLMEQLKKERGLTVVMVSHDLNMAAMYADRLLLLSKGRIAGQGAPGEVIRYDLLEAVYGCPLVVDQSPTGEYPRVHMVPRRYLTSPPEPPAG
jgi:iron complex transport system ATP-binding protein